VDAQVRWGLPGGWRRLADVQLERGYTRIANALAGAFSRASMPGQHHRVMWAMIRLLYGWQKKSDRIASKQIALAAEMEDHATRRVLADLVEWKLLAKIGGGPGKAAVWSIQKDFEQWEITATGHAKRLRGKNSRAQSPGRRAPGKGLRSGEEPRGSSTETPGAEPRKIQGAEPPLQRKKENFQRELHPSGGADGGAARTHPSRWLNLLKGQPPNGYESEEAWLDEHLPIIEGEVDKELGAGADATQRNGAIKARLCRYWRNKSGRAPPWRVSTVAARGRPDPSPEAWAEKIAAGNARDRARGIVRGGV